MKNLNKTFKQALTVFFTVNFLLLTANCFSQGSAINTTGAAADPSAILDISSNEKGVLIPRITELERTAISNPARGLMVYQIDNEDGFWYFNGTSWLQFGDNLGNHIATDSLNMTNNKVVNLATCTQNLDAANKEYVDNAVSAGGGGSSMPSMISNESAIAYTYAEAVQYCDGLSENTYTDWAIPSRDELLYFSGITSATTNFLWTKTTTKPNMYPDNQNFETVRLTDGKWRNGIDLVKPFLGIGINSSTTSTSWTSFGIINPNATGNILITNYVYLNGLHINTTGSSSSYRSAFRIKYNYADGTYVYSPEYVSVLNSPVTVSIENKEQPIHLNSIELQGKTLQSYGTAYATLSISGYESSPDQKDGNTLYVRCVR